MLLFPNEPVWPFGAGRHRASSRDRCLGPAACSSRRLLHPSRPDAHPRHRAVGRTSAGSWQQGLAPRQELRWGTRRPQVGRACWKARRLLSGSWWPWSSAALFGVLREVVTGKLNGSLRLGEILGVSPCLGWGGRQLPFFCYS